MASITTPLVPANRKAITAAWLTQALCSTGAVAPGTRVIACDQQPIAAFAHFLHDYRVSTLTLLIGNIIRGTTFVKPSVYNKMAQDPKQAESDAGGRLVSQPADDPGAALVPNATPT